MRFVHRLQVFFFRLAPGRLAIAPCMQGENVYFDLPSFVNAFFQSSGHYFPFSYF